MSKRVRYKYPTVYFEKNLIFTRGKRNLTNISGKECWAVYKIGGYSYEDFNSDAEKIDRLIKNSRAFQQVFQEAHLLEIPIKSKMEDSLNYLRGIASGEMKPIALGYVDKAEDILVDTDSTKESNDYESYFVVKLKKPRTLKDIKDLAVSVVKEPYRAVNELFGLDVAEIFLKEIQAFVRLEESLKKSIKKYLNIIEVNELEIEKLSREPFFRGLPSPKLRGKEKYYDSARRDYRKGSPWRPSYRVIQVGDQKILRPVKRDILTLCEGNIQNKPRHIEITHCIKGELVTSYQMFVVVSNLPTIPFPDGREWIYKLRTSVDFPVWPSIRYVKKEYTEVLQDINKKRKELDDQLEHSREANAKISQQHMEQDEDIDRAKYEVEGEKKPFLYSTILVGVAADNLNDCVERAKAVQDFFDEMDIESQIPVSDQFKCFNEMLIGGKQYMTDFIHRFPPEVLAGSMVGASTIVGNELGIPIGADTAGKPVKFDPSKASQINESPSISFTGTLGRGKSLLANLIALWAALLGARVLIIDPKGERGDWAIELPHIKPYLNIIALTPSSKNRGMLDIYQILIKSLGKNPAKEKIKEVVKQASEYALSILGALAGYKTKDEKMEYLADAVNMVGEEENPCMSKVISCLQKLAEKAAPEERKIYQRIASTINNRIKNTAYAHLLFGTGTEEVIDITKPINILQTQNLTLPDEGKPEEDFTYQEMVGMAMQIAMSAVGMHFALQGREFLKMYVQDEASVLKRSAQGKAMHNRMVKMGRSENAPILIIGQNIGDLGDSEDIRANIGTRFCFGTKTMAEAKNILRYIGLDEEDKELQKLLVDLPTGVCLMRDVFGRIKFIATDPLFDEFLRAFDTRPPQKKDGEDEEEPMIQHDEGEFGELEDSEDEYLQDPSEDEEDEMDIPYTYEDDDMPPDDEEGLEDGIYPDDEELVSATKDAVESGKGVLDQWGK